MIYQCYFKRSQRERLFCGPVYCGFGLEPSVNASVLKNCPELEDPKLRLALAEYGAFLNLWRNDIPDEDNWIGFTSYRQKDKTPFQFSSKQQVRWTLWTCDCIGWGAHRLRRKRRGKVGGAARQAEIAHPGIMDCLQRLANEFYFKIPSRFYSDRIVFFANYWVMSRHLFSQYMEWSWPKVEWCLEHINSDPFLRNQVPADSVAAALHGSQVAGKSVGYVAERLFIIWYMLSGLRIKRSGPFLRF